MLLRIPVGRPVFFIFVTYNKSQEKQIMKMMHIADLHFGKSLHGVSMLEAGDQPAWVQRFLDLCDEVKPDAVLIAGDVYDRASPGGEAVALLDRLLTGLADRHIAVMMAAGNHDGGEKVEYGRSFLRERGVYVSGVLQKELTHVTLEDGFGPVCFWLMPYVYPARVSQLFDEDIHDYQTAVTRILDAQNIDWSIRNVLIAHQNVTASGTPQERGGSESMVGGIGEVDAAVFADFDYTALGHIHAAYSVGSPKIRYAGSPLCYHFNELRQKEKGPLLVELKEKGSLQVQTLTIPPLHPLKEIRGKLSEILQAEPVSHSYVRAVVADQRITPEISDTLAKMFSDHDSILMELTSAYENYSAAEEGADYASAGEKPLEELFAGFYAARNHGSEPDDTQMAVLKKAAEIIDSSDMHEPLSDRETDALMTYLSGHLS